MPCDAADRARAGSAAARVLRAVQIGHLGDQLVQAEARDLHLRGARVLAEGVHHLLHGLDLLHDGVRGALEDLARRARSCCRSRRRRRRSAESWIGVSGFLISCARRRATSPQAASRCACSSAVMSSNTMTNPTPASSPGSGVQAHISVRRPPAPSRSSCSRHSSRPAAKRTASAATNCPSRSLLAASSGSARPVAGRQVHAEDRARPPGWPCARCSARSIDEHAGRQARQDDREPRRVRAPPPAGCAWPPRARAAGAWSCR